MIKLWLVAVEEELAEAWSKEFKGLHNVHIKVGNILDVARNCIVSPANSYGFMDGGIDEQYTSYFGLKPQNAIQDLIANRPEGYLPVGTAVLVKTGNKKIPYMISAPTMMGPEQVGPSNAFFAMSAVLNVAYNHKDVVKQLYCPGLTTGIGNVSSADAAREMASAYKKWLKKINKQK